MIRRLLTRRWLGALAAAVLFAFVAYHLGGWQYSRHEGKVARNDRIERHLSAAPVPVGTVLDERPMPLAGQWLHVSAEGEYLDQDPIYVRNRSTRTEDGFEVLALLRLASGAALVVDRGFVPYADGGATVLPPTAPIPPGPVTVTGWLQPGEPEVGAVGAKGQLASIDLAQAARSFGVGRVLGGYLRLEAERLPDGSTAARPAPLDPPDESLGPHLAYAVQWWMSMPVGFVLIWFGIRRELRAEDPDYIPKPKKPRIWDEEDE